MADRRVGPYRLLRVLGSGATGKVRLAINEETQEQVAIKIIRKDYLQEHPALQRVVSREISILRLLSHPHVVRMYNVYESPKRLYIALEYAPNGELFDYLLARKALKEEEACKFFQQLVAGVDYCHRQRVCHRDLKPENLLLDAEYRLKIADFGMACVMKPHDLQTTSCGSPHFAAPEVVEGVPYDGRAADVWSIGVILYALLTGCLPFHHENVHKLLRLVRRGEFRMPEHISEPAKHLLQRLLTRAPHERITLAEVRQHAWFNLVPVTRDDTRRRTESLDSGKRTGPSRVLAEQFRQSTVSLRQPLETGSERTDAVATPPLPLHALSVEADEGDDPSSSFGGSPLAISAASPVVRAAAEDAVAAAAAEPVQVAQPVRTAPAPVAAAAGAAAGAAGATAGLPAAIARTGADGGSPAGSSTRFSTAEVDAELIIPPALAAAAAAPVPIPGSAADSGSTSLSGSPVQRGSPISLGTADALYLGRLGLMAGGLLPAAGAGSGTPTVPGTPVAVSELALRLQAAQQQQQAAQPGPVQPAPSSSSSLASPPPLGAGPASAASSPQSHGLHMQPAAQPPSRKKTSLLTVSLRNMTVRSGASSGPSSPGSGTATSPGAAVPTSPQASVLTAAAAAFSSAAPSSSLSSTPSSPASSLSGAGGSRGGTGSSGVFSAQLPPLTPRSAALRATAHSSPGSTAPPAALGSPSAVSARPSPPHAPPPLLHRSSLPTILVGGGAPSPGAASPARGSPLSRSGLSPILRPTGTSAGGSGGGGGGAVSLASSPQPSSVIAGRSSPGALTPKRAFSMPGGIMPSTGPRSPSGGSLRGPGSLGSAGTAAAPPLSDASSGSSERSTSAGDGSGGGGGVRAMRPPSPLYAPPSAHGAAGVPSTPTSAGPVPPAPSSPGSATPTSWFESM